MKPVVALVGRPNVGKSTLFNRLTKSRDAIVADFAGLTRDRHYGNGKQGKHEFIAIDTGGFEPDAESGIFKEMAKQTRQAVAEADVVVFVVDARAGLSGADAVRTLTQLVVFPFTVAYLLLYAAWVHATAAVRRTQRRQRSA